MSEQLVYLALGSNLGQRLTNLRSAVLRLGKTPGLRIVHLSPVYHAEAHVRDPNERQGDFLNMIVGLSTSLSPFDILDICLTVESEGGRVRGSIGWRPRTIDIDILVHADYVLKTDRLTIPHPRMAERRFVLMPMNDVSPNLQIPAPFNASVSELLLACPDQTEITCRYSGRVFDIGGSEGE